MGWITPKTWSSGETLTAANFNIHIRDNLLAVGPHLIVRKPSDESLTSNSTMQDDDDLLLALEVNTTYRVHLVVLFTANPTPGNIKIQFTMPASCSVFTMGNGVNIAGTNWTNPMIGTSSPTSVGDFLGFGAGTAGDVRVLPIEGVVVNGANTGNFRMQWAQNSTSTTATVVKANSTLWAVKLA
jgi:hypothetical protein